MAKDFNIKEKVLEVSIELFYENGYDNTSIQNIIDTVQISKGALYHYFKSKEEILEEIASRYAGQTFNALSELIENEQGNALDKFNALISVSNEYKTKNINVKKREVIGKIFTQYSDIKTRHKIEETLITLIQPIYIDIITQGQKEGVFDIISPKDTAHIFLRLMFELKKELIVSLSEEKDTKKKGEILKEKLEFMEHFIEKILGVKHGSIQFAENTLERYKQNHK
ncbi:MAG: TetR/AcrR family transcriptional regulator [Candidatus Gracilibacteria bacterium]